MGEKLEKLALYRCVFPKATQAECRAYLFNLDPTVDPVSNSQLHRAEKLLGLRRKAASATADQAYTSANMMKRDLYWSEPPPLGVNGVPTRDMIDVDEAGFKLEDQIRKFGKTVSALRCDQPGVYGSGAKANLLLAISGDPVLAMRWWDMWRKGGTTLDRFANLWRPFWKILPTIHKLPIDLLFSQ